MFSEMVRQLKHNEMPDLHKLRLRFDRALIKKIGVINTPYSFWPSDPKINPSTKELVWAAILLEDRENYQLLAGIIATEHAEKKRASGCSSGFTDKYPDHTQVIDTFNQEFLGLPPSEDFRKLLQEKMKKTTS